MEFAADISTTHETKEVKVEHLKEGMTLAYHLLDDQGILVAKKATKLDASMISALTAKAPVFYFKIPLSESQTRNPLFDPKVLQWGQLNAREMFRDIRANKIVNRDHLSFCIQFIEDLLSKTEFTRLSYINLLDTTQEDDDWFVNHNINVALMIMAYSILQRLPHQEIVDSALSGLLHDVGHTVSAWELLMSNDELSREEALPMRMHPHKGYELMKDLPVSDQVKQGILFHHERYDENGYPTTLPYIRLPLLPKIVAIADFLEAVSHPRPYKKNKGLGMTQALAKSIEETSQAFEYEILSRFIRFMGPLLTKGEIFYQKNQLMKTNFGEMARFTAFGKTWMTPEIEILVDEKNRTLKRPFKVNLGNDFSRQIVQILSKEESEQQLVFILRETGRYEEYMKELEAEKKALEKAQKAAQPDPAPSNEQKSH